MAGMMPRRDWTRSDLSVIEAIAGAEGVRFELIAGELIDKTGKERRHVVARQDLADALKSIFGADHVNQEAPIDVAAGDNARNEPEPDVVVLKRRSREIAGNPTPQEVVLVAEVADTTLRHDLTTKAALYARAGIPEYWVLDLNGRRLLVRREPVGGSYRVEFEVGETQSVSPLGRSEAVAVGGLV